MLDVVGGLLQAGGSGSNSGTEGLFAEKRQRRNKWVHRCNDPRYNVMLIFVLCTVFVCMLERKWVWQKDSHRSLHSVHNSVYLPFNISHTAHIKVCIYAVGKRKQNSHKAQQQKKRSRDQGATTKDVHVNRDEVDANEGKAALFDIKHSWENDLTTAANAMIL